MKLQAMSKQSYKYLSQDIELKEKMERETRFETCHALNKSARNLRMKTFSRPQAWKNCVLSPTTY